MKLWQIGILIILVGSLINGLLIRSDIGGIAREFMRLVILSGIGIFLFGLIRGVKRK